MWVEGGDIHDELLDQLGGVLAPPADLALTPSGAELEALAAAVASRWPDGAAVPGAQETVTPVGTPAPPGSPIRPLRSGGRLPLRRLGSGAWRAGSVAAGIVLVSASAAAAANGGVPLPRPVRVVAYTVGLPVDSPALDDTNQHIKELKEAVKAQDKPKAEATVRRLRTDLSKVPADEKKEAVPKVEAAIAVAADKGMIPSPAPTTTTTTSPPPSITTAPAPAPSTTATTTEEQDQEQEKDKPAATTTTTTEAPTTTTESDPTTSTTAPAADETPSGEDGTSTGDGGSIGTDPGPTTTAPPPDETTTTTTTTAPPPDETTTTTTTEPSTTTTTAPTTQPSTVEDTSPSGQASVQRQRRP